MRLPQKPQRDPVLTVRFRFQTAQRDQTQQPGRHIMLRGAQSQTAAQSVGSIQVPAVGQIPEVVHAVEPFFLSGLFPGLHQPGSAQHDANDRSQRSHHPENVRRGDGLLLRIVVASLEGRIHNGLKGPRLLPLGQKAALFQPDHDGHVPAALQGCLRPCPDHAVLKLDLSVKAKGPNVAGLVRQGRTVLHADGDAGRCGENGLVRVDEAVVEAVGVGIGPREAANVVGHRIVVSAVFRDAPAQLHAAVDLQKAALPRLFVKGGVDIPLAIRQNGVGAVFVGNGEPGIRETAAVHAIHIEFRALRRVGGKYLGHMGRAVRPEGYVGSQCLHPVRRQSGRGAERRRQQRR